MTDSWLAILCAKSNEKQLEILETYESCTNAKEIRQAIMSAWGNVRKTNAWNLGVDAFDLINKGSVDAYAYWCWYTSLAIDLSNAVRSMATKHKIALPE